MPVSNIQKNAQSTPQYGHEARYIFIESIFYEYTTSSIMYALILIVTSIFENAIYLAMYLILLW